MSLQKAMALKDQYTQALKQGGDYVRAARMKPILEAMEIDQLQELLVSFGMVFDSDLRHAQELVLSARLSARPSQEHLLN